MDCRNSKSFLFQRGQERYCAFRRARNKLSTFENIDAHKLLVESLKARDHFEGLGLDRRIILKRILKGCNKMSVPVAAHLLRSWVRIPRGAWIFVCCECCVLSGRGLCGGLIIRSEETYRLWRVAVCDQVTSYARRLKPDRGL